MNQHFIYPLIVVSLLSILNKQHFSAWILPPLIMTTCVLLNDVFSWSKLKAGHTSPSVMDKHFSLIRRQFCWLIAHNTLRYEIWNFTCKISIWSITLIAHNTLRYQEVPQSTQKSADLCLRSAGSLHTILWDMTGALIINGSPRVGTEVRKEAQQQ